jgi:hypothetical protein
MPDTITCTAELTVDLPRAETLPLFTAEGERRWAGDTWDPSYPAPGRTEGPGAVFVTAHGPETTWIMVDQHDAGVRYARVAPGVAAGTVAVDVIEAAGDHTRVRVTYDLTALSDDGRAWLEAFADGYDAEIAGWEQAIAARDRATQRV